MMFSCVWHPPHISLHALIRLFRRDAIGACPRCDAHSSFHHLLCTLSFRLLSAFRPFLPFLLHALIPCPLSLHLCVLHGSDLKMLNVKLRFRYDDNIRIIINLFWHDHRLFHRLCHPSNAFRHRLSAKNGDEWRLPKLCK